MKAVVAISLGSNINPEVHLKMAVLELHGYYAELTISPVYQTAAVGFEGEDFLNLVIRFETDHSVKTVVTELKSIEDKIGRDRSQPKFSARAIDLDLLTYNQLVMNQDSIQIPRDEILKNAFVLKPLSDIMGDEKHPEQNKTYAQLWSHMKQKADRIELYPLDLG